MKYIIHADDFGITRGVTDAICATYDSGALTSTSIIPNGHAFEYAMAAYKNRPGIRLSIHLNLVEGKPLLPAEQVPFLVNKHGEFYLSFFGLWMKYIKSGKKKRHALKNQVKQELTAQILRVLDYCRNDYAIKIDSHLHYHLIPFVFDALCELHGRFDFTYIRLPSERFFFTAEQGCWRAYLGFNLVKNILLRVLSRRQKIFASENGIISGDYFLGVLFSGRMSLPAVTAGMRAITRDVPANNAIVEVLFHPGGADAGEENFWRHQPKLRAFYFSEWREKERALLRNDHFIKNVVSN